MQEIVSAWGGNSNSRSGIGDFINGSASVPVKGLAGVRKVDAGSGHVVVFVEDSRESPGPGFSLATHSGTVKP